MVKVARPTTTVLQDTYHTKKKPRLLFAFLKGFAVGLLLIVIVTLARLRVQEHLDVTSLLLPTLLLPNNDQQSPPPPPPPRKVHFFGAPIHIDNRGDPFAASWLQTREDFMAMDFGRIKICEDAAFVAFWMPPQRQQKLRMTVDWLDFAVEHLSKWHKTLRLFSEEQAYQAAIAKLDYYSSYYANNTDDNQSIIMQEMDASFRDTIAMIAFQSYNETDFPERAYVYTKHLLGATIESLRRAGFGRVLIVGLYEKDGELVRDTIDYLKSKWDLPVKDTNTAGGSMVVEFVLGSIKQATANKDDPKLINVPKAAVDGLRQAFLIATKDQKSASEVIGMASWLGNDPSRWKYVYLTEPDTILHVRPNALPQLQQQIDQGRVLAPHRLQPIPHQSDVHKTSRPFTYLPNTNVWPVHEVDPRSDVCCDAYQGKDTKPGLPPMIERCPHGFWHGCDFNDKTYQDEDAHKRLKPYGLIRFQAGIGTGIVSLAGSVHGRPCAPQQTISECPPKPEVVVDADKMFLPIGK